MTDMPDLPERIDDKTAEDAGHDLSREMSRLHRGGLPSDEPPKRAARLGSPIRAKDSTRSSRTVPGPSSSWDAIRRRAGLACSDARLDCRTTVTR
jgi:hypothetical protein